MLNKKIEKMQEQLNTIATARGLNDGSVIGLSQELDKLITEYYKSTDGFSSRRNTTVLY